MADPPLSQLGVALQAALDQELTKALTLATGTATSLPDNLQGASHTLVLSGTVLPQPADADPTQVVVQTSAGQVSLSLSDAADLPKGTITLVVQPAVAGNPPAISIVAQQRPPAAVQVPQTDSAATEQIQLSTPQVQAAIPTLTAGQTVTATLLPDAVRQAPPLPPQTSHAPASASSGQGAATPAQPTATLLQNAVRPADAAPPGPAYATLLQQSSASPVQQAAAEEIAEPGPAGSPPLARIAAQQGPAASPPPETADQPQATAQPGQPPALQTAGAQPQATPQPAATLLTAQLSQQPALQGFAGPAVVPTPASPVQANSPQAVPQPAVSSNPLLDAQAEPIAQSAAYAPQPQTASFVVLQVTNPGEPPGAQATQPAAPTLSASLQLAATPQAGSAAAQPPFTATVVGQSTTNQPLLSSPQGGLLLTRPAVVQVGAQVTLQRVPQAQAEPSSAGASVTLPLSLQAGQSTGRAAWPALTQLLETVKQAQPGVAANLTAGLPNTASATFARVFASFLAPGSVPSQLPADLSLAQGGRQLPESQAQLVQTLVRQLQEDLGTVARAASGPVKSDEWRAHLVPVMNGPHAETVQLYVRQHPDDPSLYGDADRKTSATTRFLVEIAPQQFGPVQLDGLLRQLPQQPLRLDLVIRTTADVGDAASAEMSGLFQAALVNSGLQGSVRFQPGQEHFVQPASGTVHQMDRLG